MTVLGSDAAEKEHRYIFIRGLVYELKLIHIDAADDRLCVGLGSSVML